jgi:ABC-type nitrate/sulfonate/bicarbonate transport system substrate-binding protein
MSTEADIDWMWCAENPKEAAAEITKLRGERDAALAALKDIDNTISSGDRPTVTETNAFVHFNALNRKLVDIRGKARAGAAMVATDQTGGAT